MSAAEQATPVPSMPPAAVPFGGVTPILRVRALADGVAYYTRALGFTVDWTDDAGFVSLSRGDCQLFLCEGDQGHPGAWVYVGVADAEAAHAELRARGATIRQPPTNFAWALELQVEDPDGNVLRLGSDPLPDVPFGPWRDMRGALWMPEQGGGWTRLAERTDEHAVATPPAAAASVEATAEVPVATPAAAVAEAVAESVGDAEAAGEEPAEDVAVRARRLKQEGEQARRAGDRVHAQRLYEEAVALQRTLDDPLELAHTLRHLGDVLHDARQPAFAEPYYHEALALYRAQPAAPPLNLANAIRSHAVLKHEIGERDAARRLWEEAARLYQQANVGEGVAESAGWAARLAWRGGDLSRAREWLAAARAASDASSDPATWKFVREVGLELGG
jgi:tetratricopeptide (TPR) repeat protein